MTGIWKVIITILLLSTIVADANRARRRRRQTVLNAAQPASQNKQVEARQQPILPNVQGQQQQQFSQSGFGIGKDMNVGQAQGQAGRQYYPYQNQYQTGSQGLNYYPYTGVGAGSQYGIGSQYGVGGQYGAGQYAQYGQGVGGYSPYYNQNPYPNSFYSGYNTGYNNPSGYSNNYPSGSNYGSGYFWNAGQKQNVNTFIVFLSSFLALAICLITV